MRLVQNEATRLQHENDTFIQAIFYAKSDLTNCYWCSLWNEKKLHIWKRVAMKLRPFFLKYFQYRNCIQYNIVWIVYVLYEMKGVVKW